MTLDDTIVAIATPAGRGGIGIIRLAGPQARLIAESMLQLKHPLDAGRAILGELFDTSSSGPDTPAEPPSRIDEVVVTFFPNPHSYTTDDIVEISCHGSPVVLRHAIEMCLARGARLAEPGEFTMRAFLNGRLDLTQAESVRDLIDSRTLFQAKVAAQQLGGSLSRRLHPIKQTLLNLIALLEAGIDFAEDDVSIAADATILQQIAEVREPLEKLAASFAYGKLVHQGLTLTIVGRPNVGKSSLFNRLVERERAIVTAHPGTTRDLVSETVAIGGIPVQLIDTAGIRHALDEAESIGIQKSKEALADADLVLVVLDATQPISEEDRELLKQVESRPAIIVKNKSDLCPSREAAEQERPARECRESTKDRNRVRFSGRHEIAGALSPAGTGGEPDPVPEGRLTPHIATSALTGDGIPELRAAILRHAGGESASQIESGFLTNARHQNLVADALAALEAATQAVAAHVPHEMMLLDLYNALRPLDEITGATTADDILNLIFGSFCIGK